MSHSAVGPNGRVLGTNTQMQYRHRSNIKKKRGGCTTLKGEPEPHLSLGSYVTLLSPLTLGWGPPKITGTEFSARVAGSNLHQIILIQRFNEIDMSCIHFSCLNLNNICPVKGEKISVSVYSNYFYYNFT